MVLSHCLCTVRELLWSSPVVFLIAFTVYTVRLCRESVFQTVFLTVYRYSSRKQRLQKECLWRVLFSVKDDKEEGLRVK